VLLRLGYLTVSNVFAVLRLLPMGDRPRMRKSSLCGIRSPYWNVNSAAGAVHRSGPGVVGGHCCTGYPKRRFGDCGCSYAPTRCCAGTAT
jgi:hypothetical protein